MVLVVVAAGTGLFNIVTAALAGVALMVFTGCVRIDEVYAELDWLVVFVLAGLLPLGFALDKTGAASLLASGMLEVAGGWGVTGLTAAFWFSSATLGMVIASAMIINLLVAGLFGAGIPIVLNTMGSDPAVSSTVLLTTITDVVGFLAFLGLAALFLI